MQKLVLFFFISLFISSCVNDGHKKIIVQDSNGYFREEYMVKDDSIKDGVYKKFFSNGKIADSCVYKNDTIVGERKIFSEKGYLEISETYENGTLQGPYFIYYPNGQIKFKQTFINNSMEGYSYGYYEDGAIKEKVLMKFGEENGDFEDYYPTGKIHWKGTYLTGDNENDTLYEYGLNGQLLKKMFCVLGVCNTVWTLEKGNVKPDSKTIISEDLVKKALDSK